MSSMFSFFIGLVDGEKVGQHFQGQVGAFFTFPKKKMKRNEKEMRRENTIQNSSFVNLRLRAFLSPRDRHCL